MAVAVPLISVLGAALVSGLVSWVVARGQARTARQSWVLDKRYELYERLVVSAAAITGTLNWPSAMDAAAVKELRLEIMRGLRALELVAPERIRDAAVLPQVPLAELGRPAEDAPDRNEVLQAFLRSFGDLVALLRDDLLPPEMR